MNVSATDWTSSPETPKSQILNRPSRVTRMLDGLMSVVQSQGTGRVSCFAQTDQEGVER